MTQIQCPSFHCWAILSLGNQGVQNQHFHPCLHDNKYTKNKQIHKVKYMKKENPKTKNTVHLLIKYLHNKNILLVCISLAYYDTMSRFLL